MEKHGTNSKVFKILVGLFWLWLLSRRQASAGHLNHWYDSGKPCAQHGQRTDSGCSLPFPARTVGMTGLEPAALPQSGALPNGDTSR